MKYCRVITNDESGSLWDKAVIAYLKVLSQHQFEGTEENHETFQSA
jgi:hypothetical protein